MVSFLDGTLLTRLLLPVQRIGPTPRRSRALLFTGMFPVAQSVRKRGALQVIVACE
jgi:hypothetical protein